MVQHACLFLIAAAAWPHVVLALPTAGADGVEPGPLSEALDAGNECVRAPSSDASGDGPSACSLNALQLRRRLKEHKIAASGSSFESATDYLGAWANEGRCSADAPHEVLFAVRQLGLDRVREMVLDRSNPASPNFREWLTRDEVARVTRNEAGLQALKQTLGDHASISVVRESRGGEYVRARAPVGTWEQLLSTEFHVLRHREHGETRVRAHAYSLPQHLRGHVDGVLNVLELSHGELSPSARSAIPRLAELFPTSIPGTDAGDDLGTEEGQKPNCSKESPIVLCDSFDELKRVKGPVVSPQTLREAYDLPPVDPVFSLGAANTEKTSQMVYASLGQYWSPRDRAHFQQQFGLPLHNVTELDKGNGQSSDEVCETDLGECAEGNLDVEYMMSMSPWSKMGYYYMPKSTTMIDFLEEFATLEEPPHVVSISYGGPELMYTRFEVRMFNDEAMKLALQGVTIVVASGDDGAANILDRDTRLGDCWMVDLLGLQASFPASSPWVTSVGATMGIGYGGPEVVCSTNATGLAAEATSEFPALITSGGGFSDKNGRPSWQDGHHDGWGRGVPDVSLAGHAYATVIGGKWLTVDGTSASSPAFAGMVSLINARRMATGKPRVGFLNPLLYNKHAASAFKDITVGDNRCGGHGFPCCGGYEAGVGWDAATGLGSVNFTRLDELLSVWSP